MSRQAPKSKSWMWKLVGAGICLWLAQPMLPDVMKQAKTLMRSQSARRDLASDWASELKGTYRDAYDRALGSMSEKLEALRQFDREISMLRLDNVELKQQVAQLQFNCHSKSADASTKTKEVVLEKETGSHVGRALDGISYRPPALLLPSQLFVLGVSYFKAHEDEKAAVIMTQLTGGEGRDAYRTAKNLLITGVIWYRLGNYNLADYYFEETLKQPDGAANLQALAQARVWKALIEKRDNDETKVQYWLTELIDHSPHAREAAWVNPKEADRATASQ